MVIQDPNVNTVERLNTFVQIVVPRIIMRKNVNNLLNALFVQVHNTLLSNAPNIIPPTMLFLLPLLHLNIQLFQLRALSLLLLSLPPKPSLMMILLLLLLNVFDTSHLITTPNTTTTQETTMLLCLLLS